MRGQPCGGAQRGSEFPAQHCPTGFPAKGQGAGLLHAACPGCPGFFPGLRRAPAASPMHFSRVGLFSVCTAAVIVLTSYYSPGGLGTPPAESPGPLSVPHVLPLQSVLHTAQGSSKHTVSALLSFFLNVFSDPSWILGSDPPS